MSLYADIALEIRNNMIDGYDTPIHAQCKQKNGNKDIESIKHYVEYILFECKHTSKRKYYLWCKIIGNG